MPEDNGSVQRALGGLRADVQNLTRSIDRLAVKFDEHIVDDIGRFAAINYSLAQYAGGKEVIARWRLSLYNLIGIAGGVVFGAVLAHWPGLH